MAWKFIHEDLSEFDSKTHAINDIPVEWTQGVIVDGKPFAGMDSYGVKPDGTVVLARGLQNISVSHPDARIIKTRTIPTRQFHQVEKKLGLWSPENITPPNWEKDVVGVRIWTSNKVFDTVGIPETQWVSWFSNLPDDIQEIVLYENWFTSLGEQFRQFMGGGTNAYCSETPYGVVFGSTEEDDAYILERHPNAVIRRGKLLSDAQYQKVVKSYSESVVL
jgi:hypothetical protein